MRHDRYANPVETRILIFFQLLKFAVGKVRRVGIERGKHALNRGLSCFLVIDLAGVVGGYRRDCFVVVAFDVAADSVSLLSADGSQAAETSSAADNAAKYCRHEDQRRGSDRELPANRPLSIILELLCDFHARNITQAFKVPRLAAVEGSRCVILRTSTRNVSVSLDRYSCL